MITQKLHQSFFGLSHEGEDAPALVQVWMLPELFEWELKVSRPPEEVETLSQLLHHDEPRTDPMRWSLLKAVISVHLCSADEERMVIPLLLPAAVHDQLMLNRSPPSTRTSPPGWKTFILEVVSSLG